MEISREQALDYRLRKQFLAKPAAKGKMADVCLSLGGLQAQILSSAQMALGARVDGVSCDDVIDGLWKKKTLAKMWTLRSTVHLINSRDVPLFLSALKPMRESAENYAVKFGLTRKEIDRLHDGVMNAVEDGPKTRKEICEFINPKKGSNTEFWLTENWGGTVKIAIYRGDLIFGPSKGNEAKFIKRDDWLPGEVKIDEKDAQIELLRRYLASYGPADIRDFTYWSGFKQVLAKPLFAEISDELVEVEYDSKKAFILKTELPKFKMKPLEKPIVKLLPTFDVYLLGQKEKDQIIDKRFYPKVYRVAAWVESVVLIDGKVEGIWNLNEKTRDVSVTIKSFRRFTPIEKKGIEREVGRIVSFRCEGKNMNICFDGKEKA